MKMNKNTKIITGSVVALAVIVVLGIVYAAFTQQLNINGSATGRSSKWKVYFSRLTGPTLNGTAKELVAPEIKNGSTTIGDYSVSVTSPGDYIEYEFDVTNDGDYDAKLTGLTKNSNTGLTYTGSGANKTTDENNVKSQIEYTLTYADGTTVLENDTLKSKETKTMKLKLLYKTFSDASLLPQEDVSISGLGITLTYTQDGNAKVNANGTTPYVAPQSSYSVGQQITVANETYHIISVPSGEDYVVALKDNPLTTSEVTTYGSGHINRYTESSVGTVYNSGGYGGMAYYSSATCGYATPGDEESYDDSDCTSVYAQSEVKYAVDAWAAAKFTNSELKQVGNYSARLISLDELLQFYPSCTSQQREYEGYCEKENTTPNWLYNGSYWYWTMSPWNDDPSSVWVVNDDGSLSSNVVGNGRGAVRPVINVYKSKISS